MIVGFFLGWQRASITARGDQPLRDAINLYRNEHVYLDFSRLFVIHEAQAFFVTRAKRNTKFKRLCEHPVDRINTTVLGG